MSTRLRKARKKHTCSLCFLDITVGETYHYARITPWNHPDIKDFGDYKAHKRCDRIWYDIGNIYDWTLPQTPAIWNQMTEQYVSRKKHRK